MLQRTSEESDVNSEEIVSPMPSDRASERKSTERERATGCVEGRRTEREVPVSL